jgi:hypothetical protein
MGRSPRHRPPRRIDHDRPYLAHSALTEPPFSKEVPEGKLWLLTSKQIIVDTRLEALAERASVVIVGEPGVCKMGVLRGLRHRIPAAGFRLYDADPFSSSRTPADAPHPGRLGNYQQACSVTAAAPRLAG